MKLWTESELIELYSIVVLIQRKYKMQVMNNSLFLLEVRKNRRFNDRSDNSVIRAMQRLSNAACMVEWPTDSAKSMMKYYNAVGISADIVSKHPAINKQLNKSAANMKQSLRSAGEHVSLTSGRFPDKDAQFDNSLRLKAYFSKMLNTINDEMKALTNEEKEDVKLFIQQYK
jgi:hypothetical protein